MSEIYTPSELNLIAAENLILQAHNQGIDSAILSPIQAAILNLSENCIVPNDPTRDDYQIALHNYMAQAELELQLGNLMDVENFDHVVSEGISFAIATGDIPAIVHLFKLTQEVSESNVIADGSISYAASDIAFAIYNYETSGFQAAPNLKQSIQNMNEEQPLNEHFGALRLVHSSLAAAEATLVHGDLQDSFGYALDAYAYAQEASGWFDMKTRLKAILTLTNALANLELNNDTYGFYREELSTVANSFLTLPNYFSIPDIFMNLYLGTDEPLPNIWESVYNELTSKGDQTLVLKSLLSFQIAKSYLEDIEEPDYKKFQLWKDHAHHLAVLSEDLGLMLEISKYNPEVNVDNLVLAV